MRLKQRPCGSGIWRENAFQLEQAAFAFKPPGIPGEGAVCTDDPMAGNEQRDRVSPNCPANGLRREPGHMTPGGQHGSECAVGNGLAVGD